MKDKIKKELKEIIKSKEEKDKELKRIWQERARKGEDLWVNPTKEQIDEIIKLIKAQSFEHMGYFVSDQEFVTRLTIDLTWQKAQEEILDEVVQIVNTYWGDGLIIDKILALRNRNNNSLKVSGDIEDKQGSSSYFNAELNEKRNPVLNKKEKKE